MMSTIKTCMAITLERFQLGVIKTAGINEAMKLLESDAPNSLEGKLIKRRGLQFLKKAQLPI